MFFLSVWLSLVIRALRFPALLPKVNLVVYLSISHKYKNSKRSGNKNLDASAIFGTHCNTAQCTDGSLTIYWEEMDDFLM